MNQLQRQQIIDFTPNFVELLHKQGFTRDQAADALHAAIVCLFATIWEVPADVKLSEEERGFVFQVQRGALNLIYREVSA